MIKYDASMPKCEEVRTAGVVPPISPAFGVYYELESNKLYTRPVICYVIREFLNKGVSPIQTQIKAFPITSAQDIKQMVEEDTIGGETGFLGLADDPEPKKDAWQAAIRDFKKKNKVNSVD